MKIKKFIGTFIISIFIIFSFSSCKRTYGQTYAMRDYFNSPSTMVIWYDSSSVGKKDKAEDTLDKIKNELLTLENKLSVSISTSDVAKFNSTKAGSTIEVSELTYRIVEETKTLYHLTDGAYNPTVSLLVDLWGFSPRFSDKNSKIKEPYDRAENPWDALPDQKYIDAFKQLTNFDEVLLSSENGKYYLTKSDKVVSVDGIDYSMKIDLGGYGKGYAADLAAKMIKEAGFEYGYVSFGGSSLYFLDSPNKPEGGNDKEFLISLTYPTKMGAFFQETFADYYAHNGGLSTSGSYEKSYAIDDVEYCHIIDASIGAPICSNIITANIMGGSAAENDALTTAISVMGVDKAIDFVNHYLTDRKVVFVYNNTNKNRPEVYTNWEESQLKLSYPDTFVLLGVGDGTGKISLK